MVDTNTILVQFEVPSSEVLSIIPDLKRKFPQTTKHELVKVRDKGRTLIEEDSSDNSNNIRLLRIDASNDDFDDEVSVQVKFTANSKSMTQNGREESRLASPIKKCVNSARPMLSNKRRRAQYRTTAQEFRGCRGALQHVLSFSSETKVLPISVGDRVRGDYNGNYYPGICTAVINNTYDVHYEDGEQGVAVKRDYLERPVDGTVQEDSVVLVRHTDTYFHLATVLQVHDWGFCDVYDIESRTSKINVPPYDIELLYL